MARVTTRLIESCMLNTAQKRDLLQAIRRQFVPSWNGDHAVDHWERVRSNALSIADVTPGADPAVCELFAYFHDAGRINEGEDPGHGARGAALARAFHGQYFDCSSEQLDQLCHAAEYHSDGGTRGHATVRACWDADRLDLPRVGITPNPAFLCTAFGRQIAEARHAEGRLGLPPTRIVDESGQAALLFHGTKHPGRLDTGATVDGGLHFGFYDQARMRVSGEGKRLVPAYVLAKSPLRTQDTGGEWRSKIQAAKRAGYDALVYLNRYEGVTATRIQALQASGALSKLDAMSDAEFVQHVPEARISVVVWSPEQLVLLPPIQLKAVLRPALDAPEPRLG